MALYEIRALIFLSLGALTLVHQSNTQSISSINQLRPKQNQNQNQQPQQQQPQVYVIDDVNQQKSSSEQKSWNNQKLTLRTSQAPRSAKQIHHSDQPAPYYHSYKYMGLGKADGSWLDNHYQPLKGSHLIEEQAQRQQESEPMGPYPSGSGELKLAPVGTKSVQAISGKRKSPAEQHRHQQRHHQLDNGTKNKKSKQPSQSPPVDFGLFNPESSAEAQNGTTTITRAQSSGKKRNLVCYYGTWAVYRPGAGKYPVENIDPFLCTHIIYGFTGLSYDNQIKPLDPWNDLEDNYGKGAMRRFTNLKRINPDLKTLVAIGGWNEGSIKYSKMASEPESRSKFVRSVMDFLAKYNFDGLDLDWEYPAARGGHSYDKQNFVRLLKELKEAFQGKGYLLTAAVSAGKWFMDPAYDILQVAKYLDLINLMAYDYHGGWESKTGHNAPLFRSSKHDKGDEQLLNVNWSVNYWLQQGAKAEKIMLGVGSYGRSFTLDKANVNGINAPASQKGQAGPYTREPGSLGYNEICESFQRQPQSWTIVRDPDYLAPYAYNERQWVGYDDMESLALKAQFAKSMGLGGMMMWSIETDDFLGRCHDEKYPLLNTIRRVLNDNGPAIVQPVKPSTPALPPSRPPSTPGPSSTRRPMTSRRPATVTPQSTTPGREVEDEPAPSSGSSTSTSTRRPQTTARVVPGSSTRKPSTSMRPSSRPTRPIKPTRPTTTTTTTTTTAGSGTGSGQEFICRADGMFADPRNCRKFIRCVSLGARSYSMYKFDCGPGTAFNEQQQYCDHIYNVPSCSTSPASILASPETRQLQLNWASLF